MVHAKKIQTRYSYESIQMLNSLKPKDKTHRLWLINKYYYHYSE